MARVSRTPIENSKNARIRKDKILARLSVTEGDRDKVFLRGTCPSFFFHI